MRNRFIVLLMIVSLMFMPACSIKSPMAEGGNGVTVTTLENGDSITEYKGNSYTTSGIQAAVDGCLTLAMEKEANDALLIDALQDEQLKAMVLIHGQVTDMVTNVWGTDQCTPGTNEFDAYVAYAEQQGAIYRTAMETGAGVLKVGLIAGFTYLGVDAIMSAVGTKAGGDYIEAGETVTKTGDVDSSKHTEITTDVQKQNVHRNTGEVNPLPEPEVEGEVEIEISEEVEIVE